MESGSLTLLLTSQHRIKKGHKPNTREQRRVIFKSGVLNPDPVESNTSELFVSDPDPGKYEKN